MTTAISIAAASTGRRFRRVVVTAPNGRLSAAINVTPLVDVVLVLLIIFIVVTPLLERQVDVRVPETKVAATLPADPQIVVTIGPDDTLAVDGQPVAPDDYSAKVREALISRTADAHSVFFIAHDDSSYPALVRAIDEAKGVGARVGLVTD